MNKEKIIISVLSWITVVFTLLIIVNFSLENGNKSTNTSENVVDSIVEVMPNKDTITQIEKNTLTYSIRKVAHFGIYMLLGFAMINAVTVTLNKKYFILSVIISSVFPFFFSIFDEFAVQSYSQGRVPLWTDVFIDSVGVIVGIILFITIMSIYHIIRKNVILKRKS